MDRRRLVLYLLLNVFVSACVTGAILFWYDRNYRAATLSSLQPAAPFLSLSSPQAPANAEEVHVEIVSIVGAGMLNAELVVIRNAGREALNLYGWQLKDSDRNIFTFPNLTLYATGVVQIHTLPGTNTAVDLYWGLNKPVWESGEEAQLLDANGNVRAVYRVP
ncbi:MAG TPA: lamin tail domain-containing protein [Anaerolineales bacterium]|nr:lamin tail domain-containing protein [Anaerolineales bacterium]